MLLPLCLGSPTIMLYTALACTTFCLRSPDELKSTSCGAGKGQPDHGNKASNSPVDAVDAVVVFADEVQSIELHLNPLSIHHHVHHLRGQGLARPT